MEQRLVLQSDKKYIYFISDNGISFYLMIPASSKVSLVLKLLDHVNDDQVQNMDSSGNRVLILPVIPNELLGEIAQNNLECFNRVDSIFSAILNLSHKILTYNHLEVDRVIYFDKATNYSSFYSWFLQKYAGRVVPVQLTEENDYSTSVLDIIDQNQNNIQKVEPPEPPKKEENNMEEVETEEKSFGFVSYVLLGVVVAVMSLIFLYYIL